MKHNNVIHICTATITKYLDSIKCLKTFQSNMKLMKIFYTNTYFIDTFESNVFSKGKIIELYGKHSKAAYIASSRLEAFLPKPAASYLKKDYISPHFISAYERPDPPNYMLAMIALSVSNDPPIRYKFSP